jgi:hypothetical protein
MEPEHIVGAIRDVFELAVEWKREVALRWLR